MIRRCDLVPQYEAYKKEIEQAIERVLLTGRYVLADEGAAFEKEFAAYVGSAHGVGVANATDGLILSLKALNIGDGDEVITTPFTAIPTVSAIIASGATPVFADVREDTFLIDIDKIKARLSKKTRAVMPVHIFGNVVDVEKLRTVVGDKIAIIEDAAQAHGSRRGKKQAGAMGDAGVFSFYPTKNLGAYGDGGLVATNNADMAQKLKLLRSYGMTDKDHIVVSGVNSRLDEIQAAILRAKLKHLDAMNEKRNTLADIYRQNLPSDLFVHQKIEKDVYSNYHVFCVRYKGDRDQLIRHLDKGGIQTNIYYVVPLHLQKANTFLNYRRGDFPVAEKLCEEMIALPLYPELPLKDVETVVTRIKEMATAPVL